MKQEDYQLDYVLPTEFSKWYSWQGKIEMYILKKGNI